jgi:ABC-type branched-subunit amino acid transport system ATPase component/ABC-type branched-subunit amino acid transport system permease subunit
MKQERQTLRETLRAGWLWGGLFLLLAALYGTSSGVRSEVVILFYVYAILGLGIFLPLELTDQVSLAYSAYFGIGAYSYAICSAAGRFEPAIGIVIGVVLSGLLATLVGLATFRLSGYFLTVATMLVGVAFERFLVQASPLTGGPTGLGFPKVLIGIPVSRLHLLIGGAVVVWLIGIALQNLRRSDTGKALLLMARSPAAAESIGVETGRARIVALCLGACIASLGGSLLALSSGFVIPESYNMMISFIVIFMPLIGGARSAWGSLIGAAIVAYVLQVAHQFGPSQLLFGLTTLAVVLLVPGGILGGFSSIAARLSRRRILNEEEPNDIGSDQAASTESARLAAETEGAVVGEILLSVNSIHKSYGGLKALSEVTFDVRKGEIVGIVGPNGSGKSTLIDIVTGVQEPDSGEVFLDRHRLSQSTAFRAHRGMSRTFQHPLLAPGLTVLENATLGYLRERAPRSWTGLFAWFIRNMVVGEGRSLREEGGKGFQVERFPLLSKSLHALATDVSHGTEKLTECVRAVISSPPLVIMDEPFAGLDRPSIDLMGASLRQWRRNGLAGVIVDHNIDVLRDMCDRMIVLNHGEVIAVGKPDEVLRDQAVRRAYFGDE